MPEYTTAAAVYRYSGINSTVIPQVDVDAFIDSAEAWVDQYLGTTFKSGGRTVTETLDGTGNRVLWLSWSGKDWIDAQPTMTVNSLTIDGTSVTPANLHVYPGLAKVILKDEAEVSVFTCTKPQQVVINYTYGHTAVPAVISRLTGMLAAINALVYQIGGTFDDVTSYTLPEFSASKGEPYTNIRETVGQLQKQINSLLNGIRPVTFAG